jgi:Flp pilus assembly protein TadD
MSGEDVFLAAPAARQFLSTAAGESWYIAIPSRVLSPPASTSCLSSGTIRPMRGRPLDLPVFSPPLRLSALMDRVLCCALVLWACLLAGCSHTAPLASTRAKPASATGSIPQRADLVARIEKVEAEAERAKHAGDNSQALHAYRRLLLLDPGHADAHHHLAVAADMDQDFTSAEKHYRAALDREPDNPHLHTSLGWSYFLQHRDGEAQRELQRALELDPNHATALYNLGWLAAHRGEEAQALEFFRRGGTEAQAQAVLAQVRLELQDRSPRTEDERTVARLGAPSPKSRSRRRGDDDETATVLADLDAEPDPPSPRALARTASMETEVPVLDDQPADLLSDDNVAEPRPLEDEESPAVVTARVVERPALQQALNTVDADETDREIVHAHAVETAPGKPRVAATLSAREDLRGDAAVTRAEPLGEPLAEPLAATWSGLTPRHLAAVGRAMLGPNRPSRPASPPTREVTVRKEPVSEPETTAEEGPAPKVSPVDPELVSAARLGLNLGQPAARRFHLPSQRLPEALQTAARDE